MSVGVFHLGKINISFDMEDLVLIVNALEILEPDEDEECDRRDRLLAKMQPLVNEWIKRQEFERINDAVFAKVTDEWQTSMAIGISANDFLSDRRIEVRRTLRLSGTYVLEFRRKQS